MLIEWLRSISRSPEESGHLLQSHKCYSNLFPLNLPITTHQFAEAYFCDWMAAHLPKMLSPSFHSHWWLVWSILIEAFVIRRGGHKPIWVSCRRMPWLWRLLGVSHSLDARTFSTRPPLASSISPTESWNLWWGKLKALMSYRRLIIMINDDSFELSVNL